MIASECHMAAGVYKQREDVNDAPHDEKLFRIIQVFHKALIFIHLHFKPV